MSEAASYSVRDGIAVVTMNNPPVNGLGSVLRPGIMDAISKAGAERRRRPSRPRPAPTRR